MENFKPSKFYFYTGPNYYLDRACVVFNLTVLPKTPPVDIFEEEIFSVFPKLKEKRISDVVDLFTETLVYILKMDINLFIEHYSISTDGDDYVVAVEYLDKPVTKAAVFVVK